jgi:hypothetical protein
MAISTVSQKGLDAPLTLTSPVLTTPTVSGGTFTTPNLGTPSAINLSNATALPASALPSGTVKQVVTYEYTAVANMYTNNASVASGLAASITPSSSSSRIVVLGRISASGTQGFVGAGFVLYRNSTPLNNATGGSTLNASMSAWNPKNLGNAYDMVSIPISYVDSPSTTSSTTYTIYGIGCPGANNLLMNQGENGAVRATSQIILMEIA